MATILTLGTFGPPLLTFVRSCHALDIQCIHLETSPGQENGDVRSVGLVATIRLPGGLIRTEQGLDKLVELIALYKADAIVTVAENIHLWLAEHRDRFEPACRVLSSTYESLSTLSGKRYQLELAEQSGFDVLPTWYLSDEEDVFDIADEYFPICVRPDHPSQIDPIMKVEICYDRQSLVDLMHSFTRIDGVIIAQPFKIAPDVKVHGVRSSNGEILAMRSFFIERKFQGVTLTLRDFDMPEALRLACEAFAHRGDLQGCFHFDLLYLPEEQRACYLEVNIRMGGITDKARVLGYDQPCLLLQAFGLSNRCHSHNKEKESQCRRVVNRKALVRHMLDNVQGRLSELDYPAVSRWKHFMLSVRDFLTACDSVFSWKDLKGSVWFYFR